MMNVERMRTILSEVQFGINQAQTALDEAKAEIAYLQMVQKVGYKEARQQIEQRELEAHPGG